MALTHAQTIRNTIAQAVLDAIDGGAGSAICRVFAADATAIVDIALGGPSFTRTAQLLTIIGTPEGTATASKTAVTFKIYDDDPDTVGAIQAAGTVGTTSGDLQLNSTVITSGNLVRITGGSLNYTDGGTTAPT